MKFASTLLLAIAAKISFVSAYSAGKDICPPQPSTCKCFPGDSCWPSSKEWRAFNGTLGGKLIATIPIGTPCHSAHYDKAACANIQANWHDPELHYTTANSIMAWVWTNKSCDPFTSKDAGCTLGNYVRYSVNVNEPEDIIDTLAFAKKHNIRVVVRNTGHDYFGKSTAAGAIAIWTHNLKALEYIDKWTGDPAWTGAAIKMGAGIQGFELTAFADSYSKATVSGECPTVGIAGGYTQGGGHSALMNKYGLAADNTLEFEVVTTEGCLVKANRYNEYKDLFWALSGGGGGTYGVVYSMTVRAHPDVKVTGIVMSMTANMSVAKGAPGGINNFFTAIQYLHTDVTPNYVAKGGVGIVYYFGNTFYMSPFFGAGLSQTQARKLLAPFVAKLKELGMSYTYSITTFPTYKEAFAGLFSPIDVGIAQYGGRLIPKNDILQNSDKIHKVIRNIVEGGSTVIEVHANVGTKSVTGDVYNAVNPYWRSTLIDFISTYPTSLNDSESATTLQSMRDTITFDWGQQLRDVLPDSGTYINEGDPQEPDFKDSYFGGNYDALFAIKKKYDPSFVFYAITGVGSDCWTFKSDGRMCQA